MDSHVDCCGIRFPNPVMLASGVLGTEAGLLERVARGGAGAVTSKSASPRPRTGHPNPTVLDWGYGLINAVGLANPGVEAEVEVLKDAKARLEPLGVPLVASIFAETVDGFGLAAEVVSRAQPDLIEVNISCPNLAHELGRPFALDPVSAARVTRTVKSSTAIPVAVKLSPNVTDIVEIGLAVQEAGTDAVVAINTVAGMLIDIHARRPVLANLEGGISGPAIKPVAIKAVYDLSRVLRVPVIGVGGISDGKDVIEMMMAGATLVELGSAVRLHGPETLGRIAAEAARIAESLGFGSMQDVVGVAHVEQK